MVSSPFMQTDVIVIGAGVAGLAAAGILASRGFSVSVFEKSVSIGGRARVVVHNGFVLDYGIHFARFANHGKMAAALRAMNKKIEFQVPEPMQVLINGAFVPTPHRTRSLFTTPLLSDPARQKIIEFIMSGGPFKMPASKNKSVQDLLDDYHVEKEIQNFLLLYIFPGFVTVDLDEVSSAEARTFGRKVMKVHFRKGSPVGYPKGGWKIFFETAKKRIEKNGAIRCSTPVRKILFKNGKAVGVEIDEGVIYAKAVIGTIPGRQLHRIMDTSMLGSGWDQKLRRIIPTSGISIDLCLKRRITETTCVVASTNPPLLGAFPSNIEQSLAPKNKQLATFFTPISPRFIHDKNEVEQSERILRDMMNKMFPGIFNEVEYERRIVHPIVDGALPMVGQTWQDRPPVVTKIPGLFLAGDWTAGKGAGSDIAFDSGITAARSVAKYLTAELK